MSEKTPVSSVGLRRDMEILEVLAGHGDHRDVDGFGVSWIAQRLDREKSQVSRALRALEVEGMVERDPLTRRYRLGWRLFALAARTQQSRLVQVSAPFLQRLATVFDEDTHLCILRGDMVLTLASMPSSRAYHRVWEGVSVPVIMAAAGRSLLADWDEEQVGTLLRATLPTGLDSAVGDEKRWMADLAHVRSHGYAVTAVELDDSAAGVSAPVRDHRGLIAGAISVSVTRAPVESRLREMGGIVAETARQLSTALGLPPGGPGGPPVAPPGYTGSRFSAEEEPAPAQDHGHPVDGRNRW
ncbi:DNA-binding IclR family transcriptional regulator [Streptosporangium album]|uniref:DNA-binding IclR family transcriptional regulator n=1 Tax=Streptosporangium album TaxID=47479 RepID=A0A7W7WEB6_9ACTN|nr:IclR family transcriptional regulator [Streptosporangium album]MBB4943723.1 DNA-binding IclR family transcriptional regulator [Streptosporangium album]